MKSYLATLTRDGRKQPAASTPSAANTAHDLVLDAPTAPLDLPRPKGHNLRWVIIGIIALLTITNYLDRGNLSVAAAMQNILD